MAGQELVMISIKRLLQAYDTHPLDDRQANASTRLHNLLVEGLATRHGANWGITAEFTLTARDLLGRLESANCSGADLLEVACETLELFESHSKQATAFFHEQSRQMQSMVVMLTETIGDISAQSDTSVATLQAIEHQIQQASSLDDMRSLKSSLQSCLTAVKEATVQQRSAMQATVRRLHEQVRLSRPLSTPAPPPGSAVHSEFVDGKEADYTISFKLRRLEHIRSRFGEAAIEQMFALVEAGLKPALRPRDRLMRWKRDSLLMFVSSTEDILGLRQRFSRIVSAIGQKHVEIGKNSALLGVGVDWIILPQAQYPSLERLFLDVDSFLSEKPKEAS